MVPLGSAQCSKIIDMRQTKKPGVLWTRSLALTRPQRRKPPRPISSSHHQAPLPRFRASWPPRFSGGVRPCAVVAARPAWPRWRRAVGPGPSLRVGRPWSVGALRGGSLPPCCRGPSLPSGLLRWRKERPLPGPGFECGLDAEACFEIRSGQAWRSALGGPGTLRACPDCHPSMKPGGEH
jgi:hypothetical protein